MISLKKLKYNLLSINDVYNSKYGTNITFKYKSSPAMIKTSKLNFNTF